MLRNEIISAALDADVVETRLSLAHFTAKTFERVGTELHVFGHILGNDRRDGLSPFGHGDDATVAVSQLLRISAELTSASADLFADGRHYAACALIRQIVEVEYLAWAFEAKNDESARWLRSTHDERKSFFTPSKLRKASGNRFRSVDYAFHCELGGHPVPGSWVLLNKENVFAQLMLSDCLGHTGRIWDHIVGWAKESLHSDGVLPHAGEMLERYSHWKKVDVLLRLPPPLSAFSSEG